MDLYRYFHPHHNPRLRSVAPRLQEIGELEQAARELKRAIERAAVRTPADGETSVSRDYFQNLAGVLDHAVEVLRQAGEMHPGDKPETILQMVHERKDIPGWERWSELVTARLKEMFPDT